MYRSPPEDPANLHSYITWFKLREALLVDAIEKCIAVFNQERDILEGIFEARFARHTTSRPHD
jgi:hypothetical protein